MFVELAAVAGTVNSVDVAKMVMLDSNERGTVVD